jgi:predicted phosphodiesterase
LPEGERILSVLVTLCLVTSPSNPVCRHVAVLSDVHGNAVALEAVLAEVAHETPDLVVFGGDLTWGPMPRETLRLVAGLELAAAFVRGNAERALLEPATEPAEREAWLRERHTDDDLARLGSFVSALVVEIDGLGPTRFCHGSPRSDEELVTPETPEARMTALSAEIAERVLVTAHTHLQFDRHVAGLRSVNPGSVGMPYEGRPGAYWALLGPDVELRRTEYALDAAVAAYQASGFPGAEELVEILVTPPTRDELIAHAERLEFSG